MQDEGFEISDDQEEISDDEVPEGNVVKTNPAAGSKRTKGTVVTIFVSTGDSQHEIEDYTGKNYLEVKGSLEAHGIYVLVEKKEVSEDTDVDASAIIGQDVEAGTKLSARDTITLYIPNVVSKYPDFTDGSYTVPEVQKFCDKHNVTLKVTYVTDTSYSDGAIYYQSRSEGYTITSGTTLVIKVAKGSTENTDEPEISEADCDEEMQANGLC